MKVRFVSHACFSIESSGVTLLCDPWLVGKAFNNGWALLSPPAVVDFGKVDYIWVSHQHPDHLNFPTLRSIPEKERARITVLYQRHSSPRISKVFQALGFGNVRELPLHRWVELDHGIRVMCGSVGSMDSWLAVQTERETILNLNDCVMSEPHLRYVRKLVGHVSLLFTQFSFANWIGNHADERGEVEHKLRDVAFRVQCFKPEFTVPFASFICFCNRENAWMNSFAVTPAKVLALGLPGMNFMYPGDEWDSSTRTFRSAHAIARYEQDAKDTPLDPTPPSIRQEVLEEAVNRTLHTLQSRFGLMLRIKPFGIELHDIGKVLRIKPKEGCCEIVEASPTARSTARYVMCSQVAWYTFAYTWGWGAMEVSGMYLDREFASRGENPIAFYLNVLGTEYLSFRGVRQSLLTLQFLWAKRVEIAYRLASKVRRIHRHKIGHTTAGRDMSMQEKRAGAT